MKVAISLAAILAAATSSAIPLMRYKRQNIDLKQIKQRTDFFETLPKEIQEDARLLIPELIQKYGYPSERHSVVTPDGYILELHRIPYGKSGSSESKQVVFFQHGLLSSSADWVIPGPEKSLPYILADLGYDIWLGNARGTRYSRNHTTLDPDKDAKEFFNFSWHEIATLDLPTVIDYISSHTKQQKMFYIGHSQGTTVSYVLCSEKPEYNDKFRAVFSLAPTAYLTHMKSPMRLLGPHLTKIEKMYEKLGKYEAVATNDFLAHIGQKFCNDDSLFQIICTNVVYLISGYNSAQMNTTLLPVILGHTPAGASLKQTIHYGQVFNSGIFRQWDYGSIGNLDHYGTETPPEYQLQNIKAPFELFYSKNDWMANEIDVMHLYEQLPNARLHLIPDKKFNHVDYIYAIDAPKLVFEKVINLMLEYSNQN